MIYSSSGSAVDIDLFGAEPFDPFICGPAVFTPDIQSKLDEMQVRMFSLLFFFYLSFRYATILKSMINMMIKNIDR